MKRETETEAETERQRRKDTERHRERHRQREGETERDRERQRETHTERQREYISAMGVGGVVGTMMTKTCTFRPMPVQHLSLMLKKQASQQQQKHV